MKLVNGVLTAGLVAAPLAVYGYGVLQAEAACIGTAIGGGGTSTCGDATASNATIAALAIGAFSIGTLVLAHRAGQSRGKLRR